MIDLKPNKRAVYTLSMSFLSYKITDSQALSELKVDHFVEMRLMKLSRIPRGIRIIDNEFKGEY